MKMLRICLLVVVLILIRTLQIIAQIQISTTIIPPVPVSISDLVDENADKIQVMLTNTSQDAAEVKLFISIQNNSKGFKISSNPNLGQCITLEPNLPVVLSGFELEDFIDFNALDFENTSLLALSTDKTLQEGVYDICVEARSCSDPVQSLTNTGNNCAMIEIQTPDPPTLISICDEEIDLGLPTLNISWIFVTGTAMDVDVEFTVRIAEFDPETINANDAIENATNPEFFEETFTEPFANLSIPQDLDLQPGKQYAIRVTATDLNDRLAIKNDGHSEVCTFSTSGEPNEAVTADNSFIAQFPLDNDRIPFNFFPVVVKFNPYKDNYYRHRFQFDMQDEQGNTFENHDQNVWPNNPLENQNKQLAKCAFPIILDIERATHLAYNKPEQFHSDPSGEPAFERGQNYDWSFSGHMETQSGDTLISQVPALVQSFSVGMGPSQLNQPEDNVILSSDTISFDFLTAEAPTKIIPDFYIYRAKTNKEDDTCDAYDGFVYESCRLEVSRDSTFAIGDSIKFDSIFLFDSRRSDKPDGLDAFAALFTEGKADQNKVDKFEAALYKSLQIENVILKDTGNFYWRVGWLENPDDNSSTFYTVSDVRRFTIRKKAVPEEESTKEDSSSHCIAVCSIPAPTESENPLTLTVDSIPQIGLFPLHIRTISGSSDAGFSGEGYVTIPFLYNVKVRVSFNQIKVNGDNQIFEGTVEADKDHDFNIGLLNNPKVVNALNLAGIDEDEVNAKLQEPARWLTLYQEGEMALPLALDRTVLGETYLIGIMDMKFETSSGRMQVFFSTDIPGMDNQIDQAISFGSEVCFGPEGFEKDLLIFRIEDVDVTPTGGYDVVIKGVGDAGVLDTTKITYLDWGCRGFEKLQVAGEVIFPRDHLLPVDEEGEIIDGTEQVTAEFRVSYAQRDTQQTKGNSFLAAVTFQQSFEHPDAEDWTFTVKDAYLDLSSIENPPSIKFPEGFEDESVFEPETANLWEGVFIKEATFTIPEAFQTFNQKGELSFSINDLIIDHGLSANIQALNIINYPEGNLDGWQYSLDTISLRWISSDFRKGRLAGKINIPGFEEDEFLEYFALLNRDDETVINAGLQKDTTTRTLTSFEFVAKPSKDIDYSFEALQSILILEDDSAIRATYGPNDGWEVLAILNGSLTLESDFKATVNSIPRVRFDSVEFQGFKIGNKTGFDVGDWSFTSPQKFVGDFPVNLTGVSVREDIDDHGMRMGLSLDFDINLTDVLTGESTLVVWSKLNMPTDGRHTMTFDGASIEDIGLNHEFGIVHIKGDIGSFTADDVFGDGFGGFVNATFNIGEGFEADIQFKVGKKDGYRFWLLDAFATLPKPYPPLFAGLYLSGIGGGIYHNMEMQEIPDATEFFKSYSFVPNPNIDLGLALSARVQTEEESSFNADVRLTAEFDDYSINLIDFQGRGYLMTDIQKRKSPQFMADLQMQIDFAQEVLSGNVDAYINVKKNWLLGTNPNSPNKQLSGYAGSASMYFDTNGEWKILMGTPNNPLAVNLKNLADARSYFMMGTDIPEIDMDAHGIGTTTEMVNGIAFGADLNFDTGKKTFLIFYGAFKADLNFDIALQKNEGFSCPEATDGIRGINGWFAQGLFKAGFEGQVGITIDEWFADGSFEIFEVNAEIDLLAKLPNPSYFMGRVSGSYSILGGAISGHCNFKIEMGTKCTSADQGGVDFSVIGDVDPDEGESWEVYKKPRASFNIKINEPITLIDNEGASVVYRPQVASFELKKDGQIIAQTFNMQDQNSSATLALDEWLAGNSTHTLHIAVKWQQRTNGNWTDVMKDGSLYLEQKTVTFTTKKRPDYLPEESVDLTYPLSKQRFYLQDEMAKGVVIADPAPKLDTNQPVGYSARLIKKYPLDTIELGSIELSKEMKFDLPRLTNRSVYTIELVQQPLSTSNLGRPAALANDLVLARPSMSQEVKQYFGAALRADSTWLEIRTTKLEGAAQIAQEKVIYRYHFKTSRFNSLESKLGAMTSSYVDYRSNEEKELLGLYYTKSEEFDVYDVKGKTVKDTVEFGPLITFAPRWNVPSNSWELKLMKDIVNCAEARFSNSDIDSDPMLTDLVLDQTTVMRSLNLMQNTIRVNPSYTAADLLKDEEINATTSLSWFKYNLRGSLSGTQMGALFGSVVSPLPSVWNLGMLTQSMPLAAPLSYGISTINLPIGGGSEVLVDPFIPDNVQPPQTGNIIDPSDPYLPYRTGFYLRYETSLKAYHIYRETWNRIFYQGTGLAAEPYCEYFTSPQTYVNGGRLAPGYPKIKGTQGELGVTSQYKLPTLLEHLSVGSKKIRGSLNFKI